VSANSDILDVYVGFIDELRSANVRVGSDELMTFLQVSSDFNFVFTSVTLDDFRRIMKDKSLNAIHLISHAVRVMFEVATQQVEVNPKRDEYRSLKGAINVLIRVLPLIFEDKEFFMRSMWHEQPYFNN